MSLYPGSGGHGMGGLGLGGGARGSGGGARGGRRVLGSSEPPPPLLDPNRQRDTHRIVRLFAPYRWRLAWVLALIVLSSGLSMISPFLLRAVLDKGILHHDTTLLSELVGGMIAIAIATAALSVVQTYVSTEVGQRVMHDLRVAVYRHLQRMSMAFFTRTRAGEVQSRIANDIGGIDNVATSTATTIAQNATTVIATTIAMALLSWQLAAISLGLLPLFIWMTRRVGRERRAITGRLQSGRADISALVAESLSVS